MLLRVSVHPFIAEWVMCTQPFVYPSPGTEYLGCFQFPALTNKTFTNIAIQTFKPC